MPRAPGRHNDLRAVSPITLLDGGMGRELKRMGAPFRQPEWSALALIESPEFVSRAHAAYIAAGADVITTNTYAVVPFHIGAERFRSDGFRLAELAARLARAAADRAQHAVSVAGSLPPPCGSYRADLFDAAAARPILRTLIDAMGGQVDLWLAETLSCVAEAELVRESLGPGADARVKPLWLSFTIDDAAGTATPTRLRSGESVRAAAEAAVRLGASALLFNCSQPEVMGAALDEARRVFGEAEPSAQRMQLGVYANAFPPVNAAEAEANAELSEIRADLSPAAYGRWATDWVGRGASIIGGCCGIGPEHIARLRAAL
ncbi:MAG: homocysteine S-methyltransferase family protein [Proteobacteria bacterium]|nr:homocysteine S-methyltransferase family protein [Pseudomonadota bacterium]